MASTKTSFTHPSLDGFPLAVTCIRPSSPPIGTVVYCNATGVQGRFYHPFSTYLATRGLACFTWDYRFSGNSFPPELNLEEVYKDDKSYDEALRECSLNVDISNTWTRKDLASIVDLAKERFPDVPLTLVGHSSGGSCILLLDAESKKKVSRYVSCCGGNAYFENMEDPEVFSKRFNEIIEKPLMSDEGRGVFNAKNIGLGFNLPHGPGIEWVRWARHPRHALNRDEDLERARSIQGVPYTYIGFDDDPMMTKTMMNQLIRQLNHADGLKTTIFVSPKKLGWDTCHHVTFFMPSKKAVAGLPKDAVEYEKEIVPSEFVRREEGIWLLLAACILGEEVDLSDHEVKRWNVEDEVPTMGEQETTARLRRRVERQKAKI